MYDDLDFEPHKQSDVMTEKKAVAFYKDMRFWLIIAMLTAFLVFIFTQGL